MNETETILTIKADSSKFDQVFQDFRRASEYAKVSQQFAAIAEGHFGMPFLFDFQRQQEQIFQIRRCIDCTTEEVVAYLKISPYSLESLVWITQKYSEFPLIQGYTYSRCLNCHKRQWWYLKDQKKICPYCGLVDWNGIEIEEMDFQPGEFDIEI